MTVGQNLDFVGRVHGLSSMARPEIIRTLLDVVSLADTASALVEDLSPGQRRRAALAAALVHDPAVLLLDDPLRGLDGIARLEQIEVLRELRGMGKTVLVASNLLADLAPLCDELLIMRGGRLGWRGTPAELPTPGPGDDTLSAVGVYDQALAELLDAAPSDRSG
jgi:ABC-2 type transport system ATP-binding protein